MAGPMPICRYWHRSSSPCLPVSVARVVVSVSTSQSRGGLETYQRLGLVSTKMVNVSVSAIDVSCPRPIFCQILQVTIIKLIKSVVAVKESLAELV